MPVRIARTTRVGGPERSRPIQLSQVKNSDTGLSVKSTATSITVSGVAKGPISVNPYGDSPSDTDYERTEDRIANLSVAFDRDRMPAFDTSRGYTEKNRWTAAHSAEVACRKGQTAEQVLKALATKINAGSGYRATVVKNANGSATLTVDAR